MYKHIYSLSIEYRYIVYSLHTLSCSSSKYFRYKCNDAIQSIRHTTNISKIYSKKIYILIDIST